MLLFLRPSNGLSIVFIRPFKGLFELCLWFPASLTGTNLFCFEANKWTQLKLEPAFVLSIAFTHKLRIPEAITWTHHCIHAQDAYIPEAVTWTQLSFTHKLRISLRPYMDSALHSRTKCVYSWGRTWTQHCIHAQIAYIPEANKWTHMYNKKLIV